MFYESKQVNSVLFQNSSSLSLFSTGETTGLVIESGHSITSCIPVFEGFTIPHAFQYSYLAGQKMTEVLKNVPNTYHFQMDSSLKNDYSLIRSLSSPIHSWKILFLKISKRKCASQLETTTLMYLIIEYPHFFMVMVR